MSKFLVARVLAVFFYLADSSQNEYSDKGPTNDVSMNMCNIQGLSVDCNNLGIHSVPRDLNRKIEALIMDSNPLFVIVNNSFVRMPYLVNLSLQRCKITHMEADAFVGLRHLEHLSLRYNSLSTIGYSTFMPLLKLQRLDVGNNQFSFARKYPSRAIGTLTLLRDLTIDCFKEYAFDAEFNALKKLESLSLTTGGHWNIEMHNFSFIGFRNSSVLNLDIRCKVQNIALDTFAPFTKLKHIRIQTFGYMNIRALMQSLHGLQGLKMDYIGFIENETPEPDLVSLSSSTVKYLSTMCVSIINFKQNNLYDFQTSAILKLSKITFSCVKRFILSKNHFSSLRPIFAFPFLKQIEYIDVSENIPVFHFPYSYRRKRSDEGEINMYLHIPKTLKELRYVGSTITEVFKNKYARLIIKGADSLTTVNVSYPFNPDHYDHKVNTTTHYYGLNSLKTLDVSGNNLKYPSEAYFDEFKGLEHLILRHTNLGEKTELNLSRFFKSQVALRSIDLSGNDMDRYAYDYLTKQKQTLHVLKMQHSSLRTFPLMLTKGISNLTHLDIRYNKITDISDDVVKYLAFSRLKPNTILLEGNPLICSCKQLQFYRYLQSSASVIGDFNKLKCVDDARNILIKDKVKEFNHFQFRCRLTLALEIAIPLIVSVFLCLVFGILIYRKRYFIYLYKNKQRYGNRTPVRRFLVSIWYGYDKDQMVKRHIFPHLNRLCVGEEIKLLDEFTGETEQGNPQFLFEISENITDSLCLLVPISPGLIDDPLTQYCVEWFKFALSRHQTMKMILLLQHGFQQRDLPQYFVHVWYAIKCFRMPPQDEENFEDLMALLTSKIFKKIEKQKQKDNWRRHIEHQAEMVNLGQRDGEEDLRLLTRTA